MYSTQPRVENKPQVNITLHGQVLATHRMTRKQVDKFVSEMRNKGYELEVTYNGKTREL